MGIQKTLPNLYQSIGINHKKGNDLFKNSWLIIVSIILLVSCGPPPQELTTLEHNAVLHPDATLLYEQRYRLSGATGECASSAVDRWYGLNSGYDGESLKISIGEQLVSNGWISDGDSWQKESDEGTFFATLETFLRDEKIESMRLYYQLPNSVVSEFPNYPLTYSFSINHLHPAVRQRCFGSKN